MRCTAETRILAFVATNADVLSRREVEFLERIVADAGSGVHPDRSRDRRVACKITDRRWPRRTELGLGRSFRR